MDRSGNVQLRPPHECLPAIRVAGDIVKRAGTGLGPRQIEDYELLYFPGRNEKRLPRRRNGVHAQRAVFHRDEPRASASVRV